MNLHRLALNMSPFLLSLTWGLTLSPILSTIIFLAGWIASALLFLRSA